VTSASPASAPARVLAVLEHVAGGGDTSNLSGLARETGLNRVTLMRLLADLAEEGVLERTGSGHRLGLRFLRLAAAALSGQDLTSLGQRALDGLSASLGVSAYLVTAEGDRLTYLLRALPDTPLVSRVTVGTVIPIDATTGGRAILAARARKDGHAADGGPVPVFWSRSGYEPGIDSVAAAVVLRDGTPVAALSLAAPSGRLDHSPDRRAEVEQALTVAATDLGVLLDTTRG